ncbi:MAG: ankyrin repeat domain-containing protein [Anaeromyxobacteraceae bacterium]
MIPDPDRFLAAAAGGAAGAVRDLLASAPELVRHRDRPQGTTALHLAARHGHREVVQALLDAGAEVDALETASGTTALHWAAEVGHPSVVEALVARGASLELRDAWYGYTPLGWATAVAIVSKAHRDRAGAADALRRAGAQEDVFTALGARDAAALRRLVAADPARLEQRNGFADDALTPLLWAAGHGWDEGVEALLALGADTGARCALGLTPLGIALHRSHDGSARVLVGHGALQDVSTAVVGGSAATLTPEVAPELTPALATRLLFVAAMEGWGDVVEALVRRGAEPAHRMKRLLRESPLVATPLHLAARFDKPKAVKALAAAGAPLDAGPEDGAPTALHVAAGEGHHRTVEALLAAGARRDVLDPWFNATASQWAGSSGDSQTILLLR